MATYYWIGGTADWGTSASANWTTNTDGTSDGSTHLPTATDDVVFNSYSTGVCTVAAAATCKTLDLSSSGGTLAGSSTLTIAGNVTLGGTLTYTGRLTVTDTCAWTSNGVAFGGEVYPNCSGKVVTMADDAVIDRLTIYRGTFDINGFNLDTRLVYIEYAKTAILTGPDAGNIWTIRGKTVKEGAGKYTAKQRIRVVADCTIYDITGCHYEIDPGSGKQVTFAGPGGPGSAYDCIVKSGRLEWGLVGPKYVRHLLGQGGVVSGDGWPRVYGDIDNGGVTWTMNGEVHLYGASGTTSTIKSHGKSWACAFFVRGAGKTWALADDCVTTNWMILENGTLDLNGYDLSVLRFDTRTGTKTLKLGAGTLRLTDPNTGNKWNNVQPANTTWEASSGRVLLSGGGAGKTSTIVGGGATYPWRFEVDEAAHLTITGANTFAALWIRGPYTKTVKLPDTVTTTVGQFHAWGGPGTKITLRNTSAAAAVLSQATGTVNCNYLTLSDVTPAGGAIWYAGSGSNIASGSSGWKLYDMSSPALACIGG